MITQKASAEDVDIPILESPAFVLLLGHIHLFGTPWTAAHKAPLSMGFSSQEYWPGLPSPPPGELRRSEVVSTPPASTGWLLTAETPGKPLSKLRLLQQSATDRVAEAEIHALTVLEARSSRRVGQLGGALLAKALSLARCWPSSGCVLTWQGGRRELETHTERESVHRRLSF